MQFFTMFYWNLNCLTVLDTNSTFNKCEHRLSDSSEVHSTFCWDKVPGQNLLSHFIMIIASLQAVTLFWRCEQWQHGFDEEMDLPTPFSEKERHILLRGKVHFPRSRKKDLGILTTVSNSDWGARLQGGIQLHTDQEIPWLLSKQTVPLAVRWSTEQMHVVIKIKIT